MHVYGCGYGYGCMGMGVYGCMGVGNGVCVLKEKLKTDNYSVIGMDRFCRRLESQMPPKHFPFILI